MMGAPMTKSQVLLQWTKELASSPLYAAKGVKITNWHKVREGEMEGERRLVVWIPIQHRHTERTRV